MLPWFEGAVPSARSSIAGPRTARRTSARDGIGTSLDASVSVARPSVLHHDPLADPCGGAPAIITDEEGSDGWQGEEGSRG
jgi:hypothetical protein